MIVTKGEGPQGLIFLKLIIGAKILILFIYLFYFIFLLVAG